MVSIVVSIVVAYPMYVHIPESGWLHVCVHVCTVALISLGNNCPGTTFIKPIIKPEPVMSFTRVRRDAFQWKLPQMLIHS